MFKFLLISLLVNISFLGMAQSKEAKVKSLLDAYFSVNKLNGSVLVTQKGKIIVNEGFGLRNVPKSTPIDANTVFQIGSVTKQFTAAVILKLQEMKKLSVNDHINKYFSSFPKGDSILIEHLLTHTSGVFNYTDDPYFMQTQVGKPVSEEKMMSYIVSKPLNFPPGASWHYSNSNYLMLGYIIRKVCGKPYEEVVRELILRPLKMNSTGFDYAGLNSHNKATGYKVISETQSIESTEFDSTVSYAAGALYSTTGDLQKWQNSLKSHSVLQKKSLDRLFTPSKNKYGFGIYIDTIYGKKILAHGGLGFGYTSYLGRIPEDDISIIILNNIVNTSISKVAKDIIAILFDKPYQLPVAKKAIQLNNKVLEEFTGTFQLAPRFSIVFTIENDQLVARVTGQPKVYLLAEKSGSFFVKGTDLQAEFKRDAVGKVTEVLIIEDGRVTPGRKVL